MSDSEINGRVSIQFVVPMVFGFIVPKVLFALQWRIGEWQQIPAGAALFLSGLALVALYRKTWYVAGLGALVGLWFGSLGTSKFGLFYVFVFFPWAWFGGLIGLVIWEDKSKREPPADQQ